MGRLALKAGDHGEAMRWIESALTSDPMNAYAWTLKGFLSLRDRDLNRAREAYAKSLAIAPRELESRTGLVEVLLAMGDLDEAEEVLAGVEHRHRELARVYFLEGSLAYAKGAYAKAAAKLGPYFNSVPQDLRGAYLLAASHFALGHPNRAEEVAEKALARVPGSLEINKLIAEIRLANDQPADPQIDVLLENDPRNPEYVMLKVRSLRAQGRNLEASGLLREVPDAQALFPESRLRIGGELVQVPDLILQIPALERSTATFSATLDESLKLAAGYLATGEPVRAIELLLELREEHPNSLTVINLTGVAYAANGDMERAAITFEESLATGPGNPSASRNLAKIAERANRDPGRARKLLRESLEQYPNDPKTLLTLAELEARQGNESARLDALRKAIEADPAEVRIIVRLARQHLTAGEPERALALLENAPAVVHEETSYLQVLGDTHMAGGAFEEAAASFERIIGLRPDHGPAYYAYAQALGKLGQRAEMQDALVEGLTRNPQQYAAPVLMAALIAGAANETEARASIDALKGAAPAHPQVAELEAGAALRYGHKEEAVSLYRVGRDRFPEEAAFAHGLARAEKAMGHSEAAVTTLNEWLAVRPEDLKARRMLASLLATTNRAEVAKKEYEAVLKAAPRDVVTLNNLASLLRDEDPDRALLYAEQAATLAPDAAPVLDTLGMVLLSKGKSARAVETLQKAVGLAPSNPTLRFHLAQAHASAGQAAEAKEVLSPLTEAGEDFPEIEEARDLLETLETGG